ncbi:MAG: hypothetical protein ACI4OJ_05090, partial [Lachnospiraceae bacterium]
DVDDLLKLQKLLDSGAITRQEFEREKAWILGTAGDSGDAAAKTSPASSVPAPDAFPGEEALGERPERKRKRPARGQEVPLYTAGEVPPKTPVPEAVKAPSGTLWKVLSAVLSIIFTWPVAFVLILVKKPFAHRVVNWILALWDGIATVVLIASIAYTAAISSLSGQTTGAQTADAADAALSGTGESTSYDSFVEGLKQTLQTSYGDQYTVEDDGKTLTISIWQDGVAKEAQYVIDGSSDSTSAWADLKDSLQNLSMTCFQQANSASPERHVVLNVLNDQNTENVLLSYLDGTCVYDVVETAGEASSETGSTSAAESK